MFSANHVMKDGLVLLRVLICPVLDSSVPPDYHGYLDGSVPMSAEYSVFNFNTNMLNPKARNTAPFDWVKLFYVLKVSFIYLNCTSL